jgi:hypothetical protein
MSHNNLHIINNHRHFQKISRSTVESPCKRFETYITSHDGVNINSYTGYLYIYSLPFHLQSRPQPSIFYFFQALSSLTQALKPFKCGYLCLRSGTSTPNPFWSIHLNMALRSATANRIAPPNHA